MARTIIGLDLGSASIKAVVINARFNHKEIVAEHLITLGHATTEEELLDEWRQGLSRLKEMGLPQQGSTIVAALPGTGINSRILDLPFKENKKIDTTLNGELDFQQTIENVDDLAAAWTHAKNDPAKTDGPYPVLVSTIKQDRLAAILAVLKESGFDPQMLLNPCAAWPLCYQQETPKQPEPAAPEGEGTAAPREEEAIMTVDIGASRTNIALFSPTGELLLIRTLAFGASQADNTIAEALDIPLDNAAALRETDSILGGEVSSAEQGQLLAIVTTQYRLLASQLRLTINRLPHVAITEINVTGGGSRQKGIEQFLGKELGLTVSRIQPAKLLDGKVDGADKITPELMLATGMALAASSNKKSVLMDFRRGPFAYQGELSWVKGQAIRLVIGSAAVFIFALVSLIVQLQLYKGMEAKIDRQFCQITKATVKSEICEPRAAISALQSPTGPQGDTLPPYSAIDQFVALSKGVPSDLQTTFSDLTIGPDRVAIKGTCKDFETLDKLVDTLSKLSCVTEAKQTRSTKAKDEVEFNISIKYECAPGVTPLSEVK